MHADLPSVRHQFENRIRRGRGEIRGSSPFFLAVLLENHSYEIRDLF